MAPLGCDGWRKVSYFAGVAVGSFFVSSARVSANKNLKRRSAHSAGYTLPTLTNTAVAGSEVYQVRNRSIVVYGQLGILIQLYAPAFVNLLFVILLFLTTASITHKASHCNEVKMRIFGTSRKCIKL